MSHIPLISLRTSSDGKRGTQSYEIHLQDYCPVIAKLVRIHSYSFVRFKNFFLHPRQNSPQWGKHRHLKSFQSAPFEA